LSRTALFTAKCVVHLDDGTDSAIAHTASLALVQAMLRISPVALERMADLVSREGAMQLLCGKKSSERQQGANRVCAASKVLAEMCVFLSVLQFMCHIFNICLQLLVAKSVPACVCDCICPLVSLFVIGDVSSGCATNQRCCLGCRG
jgi:hypothetical protein